MFINKFTRTRAESLSIMILLNDFQVGRILPSMNVEKKIRSYWLLSSPRNLFTREEINPLEANV